MLDGDDAIVALVILDLHRLGDVQAVVVAGIEIQVTLLQLLETGCRQGVAHGLGTLAFNNMSGLGRSGTGTLKVDGKDVQTINMKRTLPMILQWDESFDIGSDTLTGVNDADYKPPFPLTAKLNKLTVKVDRPTLTQEDIKKLEGAQAEALDGKPLTRVQPAPM